MEYKWDANVKQSFTRAKQALRKLTNQYIQRVLRITDTYLDHATADFAKEHVAFRVRCVQNKWEATFKTCTAIKKGKAVRREETLSLPSVKNLQQALEVLTRKQKWKGLPVAHLQIQFTLVNKRIIYELKFENTCLELALDNVTMNVCGRQLKMKEIELELKQGSIQIFEKFANAFAKQTQLKPVQISKVKTAETLYKLFSK